MAIGAMLVLPLAACSNNDADVFATETTTGSEIAGSVSTGSVSTGSETTLAESTTVLAGASFPVGAELLVDFTFDAGSEARARNPYIAVWIEDADGNLVKTISLWFQQSDKGTKWLSDLSRWSRLTGSETDGSVSGATKTAGSYTVAWDGTDDEGNLVDQGRYVLNIEAAREHGPYELISEPLVIADSAFAIEMTPNGELTAASARLEV